MILRQICRRIMQFAVIFLLINQKMIIWFYDWLMIFLNFLLFLLFVFTDLIRNGEKSFREKVY